MTTRWRPRWPVALVVGLVAAFVFGTIVLFVSPIHDRPTRADAIVVFGGDGERLDVGEALARRGVAPLLEVSVSSRYDPCFKQVEPYPVRCFQPDPLTTQGEARWLATTAKAAGWHDVVVVVSVPQTTRARLRIHRCYHGGLQVVGVHLGAARTAWDSIYEWGAVLKALVWQRSC